MFKVTLSCNVVYLQVRLAQAIEACDPDMNSTVTSSLEIPGLLRVLWCFTRQRPTVGIANLQVQMYSDLNAKLLMRHQQLVASSGPAATSVMEQCQQLKAETELTEDVVIEMIDGWGFKEDWMRELAQLQTSGKKGPKVGTAKAKAGPPVPELLQAVPVPATADTLVSQGQTLLQSFGIVQAKAKAAPAPARPAAAAPEGGSNNGNNVPAESIPANLFSGRLGHAFAANHSGESEVAGEATDHAPGPEDCQTDRQISDFLI